MAALFMIALFLTAVFLILLILVQRGKGGGLAGAFGGMGGQSAFGTKAGDTFATNVKLLDAESKRLLKSASSRGEGENSILRTQIDELSSEIVRGLAPAGSRGAASQSQQRRQH